MLFLIHLALPGQKIPLDHSVYDGWKSVNAASITDDGSWVTYELTPQQGDSWLYIYNVSSEVLDSVFCATRPLFSSENKYVAYQIKPTYDETRQAKKKKLKDDQMPKNNLIIRLLTENKTIELKRVKSFDVPKSGSFWMAYLLEKSVEKKGSKPAADTSAVSTPAAKNNKKAPESKGTELVIFNPLADKEFRFQDVTEYVVARDGKSVSYLQVIPDTAKIDNIKISQFDPRKETTTVLFEGKGSVKKLTNDFSGDKVAFIYTGDTSKVRIYDLFISISGEKAEQIVDSANPSMRAGWAVSENGNLSFSEDGTRVFFGTALKPIKEPEDTLLADEKYKLDIWSWNDEVLQPMQKKQLEAELKRTYLAVYHIDKKVMYQLANEEIPTVRTPRKGNSDIFIGTSDKKYRLSSSWDGGGSNDYYLVNVETGKTKLVLEKAGSMVSLSPGLKYLVYWNESERAWYSIESSTGATKNISSSISFPLYNELNDLPDEPGPYGFAAWIQDDKHLLVYDRHDIWYLDASGQEKPFNITNSYGRKNNLRLRYVRLDQDKESIGKKDKLLLSAFNYENKESGFYSLNGLQVADPVKLILDKYSFPGSVEKAKKADRIIWQKGSFSESPELYISNMTFNNAARISVSNPQQSKYNWITAELFEWTSFDNQKLQGILYKPADFDPSKKYPMIVYFYERSSDGLYTYFPPAPSASIINRTFAASNGYLVFVPDIPYKIGYPGHSCYNAVVSGTYALIDRYSFIDKSKLGLDGQSWGGYQIAYLVTKTDLFACAYAGAPVVDMVSAYGGIRWESGMSRMFQYEKTQSRIGGTLWEKPLHFIENSPIFEIPRINTPLLIMHNDADGAVPWYQGIEFITALRRVGKPAWMLSYNDEAHNLVKRPNRKDISIRKMQFFDHYLKGADIPYWMKNGISQSEKGKKDGYELIKK
jgi:dipeptidyl aminopeptidase/acylaminoacyl peptidase